MLEVLLYRIDLMLHIQHLGTHDLAYYHPKIQQAVENPTAILDSGQEARWAEGWQCAEAMLSSEGLYHFERLGAR